ncbi:hypothetical protein [Streptantibioticus silvisoli]|uniref:Uncharacterized protein n=1 Tax=Streptantibioticus silvisoli TaxID=2705255 RepID=A0ABT6W4W4_9ACTN|nr:hypothetical protein [Streptantibioticus silvisoli]MDI5965803.1 hypothetical protein [Streptantibioticus silvisoli]
MTTSLQSVPAATTAGADENHLYCCNPDLGLCGADLTGHTYLPAGTAPTCAVCNDLKNRYGPCSPGCPDIP